MRLVLSAGALALLLGVPASVSAQGLRLTYQAAEGCPDETGFVDLVRARTPRPPFASDARGELRIELASNIDGGFRARVAWLDADRVVQGRREMNGARCGALAEAVAVVAVLALEAAHELEASAARDEPQRPAARIRGPLPRLDPERPPVLTPAAPPEPGEPVRVRLGGGLGVGLGAGPLPHTVFALSAGLRYVEAGVMLSLRYADTFAAGSVDGIYAVRARILRARLAACYMPRPLSLCATGSGGMHEVEPHGLADARVGQAAFGSLGALVAVLATVDEHVSVRFDVEVAATLNQVSFTVVGANPWTVWPVLVELGVSFLYEP